MLVRIFSNQSLPNQLKQLENATQDLLSRIYKQLDNEQQLALLANARSYDFQLKIFDLTEIDVRIDFIEDGAPETELQLFEDQPYER